MIDVVQIRIIPAHPSMVTKYLVDCRFIDPDKGTHDTEFGQMLNYDKGVSFGADTMDDAIERLEDIITERLCDA
jgi:hypothetical protein